MMQICAATKLISRKEINGGAMGVACLQGGWKCDLVEEWEVRKDLYTLSCEAYMGTISKKGVVCSVT